MPEHLHPPTITVPVRWTPEQVAEIDRLRGQQTRSEFIRAAVVEAAARRVQ